MATVVINEAEPVGSELLLRPGQNLWNGVTEFTRKFGEISSLEIDLLNAASAIFACDLAYKRGEREKISRRIDLTIPVVNYATLAANVDRIQYSLLILSHDVWNIHFVPADGTPEANIRWPTNRDCSLLLFSGGLDSFSAAVDLAGSCEGVELVSHVTANPIVRGTQDRLFTYLGEKFPGKFSRISYHVTGRKSGNYEFPSDSDREETQRTRSFMFITLAVLTARRKGIQNVIYMAENGQMAIHLSLTAARISAFSTYTAHPEFLHEMQELFRSLLNFPINLQNPYLYKTKAEVIANLIQNHRDIVGDTVSCWKASRVRGGANHCGICIPCLIRRIALEYNGLSLPEYEVDLLRQDVALMGGYYDGKRNLGELGMFIKIFENAKTQAELEADYPDLVNEYFDGEQAARMYQRFAAEARMVFQKYPSVIPFLE